MKHAFLYIALLIMAATSAVGQETVRGSVRDSDTKQGIPYAAIHLLNTRIGTSCNELGQFTLHVPRGMGDARVVVSSMGYRPDTASVQALAKGKGRVVLKP